MHAQPTFEELLSGMTCDGRFDHLRIILTKNSNRTIPEKYLMVTKRGFSLIKLRKVDYHESKIKMELECLSTGIVRQISLDICDSEFKFLLISWQDIRKLVVVENT